MRLGGGGRVEEMKGVGKRKSKGGREPSDGFLNPYVHFSVTANIQSLPFHHQTISFPVPWGRASLQELVKPWLHRNYSDEAKNKEKFWLIT